MTHLFSLAQLFTTVNPQTPPSDLTKLKAALPCGIAVFSPAPTFALIMFTR